MENKKRTIILISCVILLIAIIGVAAFFRGRTAPVPEGTIGNTAGNLNNRGLFCEYNGKVYFSNAYDDGTLYSMNPDETEIRKLNNSKVEFINAGGKYLVYYQSDSSTTDTAPKFGSLNGVYRSNLKGKNTACLSPNPSSTLNLIGDYIYYSHYNRDTSLTLHKVRLDKQKEQTLSTTWVNPASCQDGLIYWMGAGIDNHLYVWNTADDSSYMLWDGNVWNPVVNGDYVYYMDLDQNYRLSRYSLSDGSVTVLTTDRVDLFNIYDSVIYYQSNSSSSPALKRMNLDGSNTELVASGIYTDINITSQYVYFTGFGESDGPVYKTSTFGPVNVTTFDAALSAAAENVKK